MESRDIVPSFYETRSVGDSGPATDGYGNHLLRLGEVKRVIYPEHKDSRSQKFIEYDVLVQHRENGTAVTKMYHNCFLADPLGGFSDYSFRSLRVDEARTGEASDDAKTVELGFGSKVLILCISGSHAEAIIISGIPDDRRSDRGRKSKGHHLEWVFNGVATTISDDGSFSIEYRGPTTSQGKPSPKADAKASGTTIKVKANGNFEVYTKDRKQVVEINHEKGTISVLGDKDLTIHGSTIHVGSGADEPAVLGNTLVKLMSQLLDLLVTDTHPTPIGIPTGPSLQAPAYQALKLQLDTALSKFITVKRTP